jgi:NAD(P)-dependent dehydrogenase (short-subunit alcohol dehydrogenase family)
MQTYQTALITGATSGIGRAAIFELAKKYEKVIFTARDIQKAELLKEELEKVTGNKAISYYLGDLSLMKDTSAICHGVIREHSSLDCLVLNAGILGSDQRQLTEEGFEQTFATNHLSPFLMSHLLLPLLRKSETPRIVIVSSEAHRISRFDLMNLQGERKYRALNSYSLSKMCNILFAKEAAERWQDDRMKVNALHPGGVRTNFGKNGGGVLRTVAFLMAKPFFISAEQGAETLVYLATTDAGVKLNGQYLKKKKVIQPSGDANSADNAQKLWDYSLALVKSKLD